jgi:hypothetical protein
MHHYGEQVLWRNSGELLDLHDPGVSKNQLPDEVSEGPWALPNAEIIDLEANQFTSGICDSVGKVGSRTNLVISGSKFSGAIMSMIGDAHTSYVARFLQVS